MVSVLVIDDSTEKLADICRVVEDAGGAAISRIDTAVDSISARRSLRAFQYDLVLLDLLLPNRVSEQPSLDGGIQILNEIDRDPKIFTPFHVIAITADAAARDAAREELQSRLWGLIEFERNSEQWARRLRQKVEYLVSSERAASASRTREHLADLAIITALSEELLAVRALPANWREVKTPGDPTIYYEGLFRRDDLAVRVVCATADRMGMSATAVLASKITSLYRPKFICMGGVAAGIEGRTNIGDVLIADPSWDWGSGKFEVVKGKGRFAADPIQLDLDPSIRARLKNAIADVGWLQLIRANYPGTRPNHELKAHVESVASGAAVVADRAVIDQIGSGNRKLHGVEMEIFGLMTAAANCESPRPLAFSAKSVCDFADADKGDAHRHYANFTSANFIYEFVLRHLKADL